MAGRWLLQTIATAINFVVLAFVGCFLVRKLWRNLLESIEGKQQTLGAMNQRQSTAAKIKHELGGKLLNGARNHKGRTHIALACVIFFHRQYSHKKEIAFYIPSSSHSEEA